MLKNITTLIMGSTIALILSGCGYHEKDLNELKEFNLSVGQQRSKIDYQALWSKLDKHYYFFYFDGTIAKYCFDTAEHTCTLSGLSRTNFIKIMLTPNKSYRIKFSDAGEIISIKKVTDYVSP